MVCLASYHTYFFEFAGSARAVVPVLFGVLEGDVAVPVGCVLQKVFDAFASAVLFLSFFFVFAEKLGLSFSQPCKFLLSLLQSFSFEMDLLFQTLCGDGHLSLELDIAFGVVEIFKVI